MERKKVDFFLRLVWPPLLNTLKNSKELFVIHSEIKQHHSDIKDAFADPKMVKIVLNYLDFLLEKSNSAEAVKTMQMADHEKILDVIKMTVTLVRNILHIPTPRSAVNLIYIDLSMLILLNCQS